MAKTLVSFWRGPTLVQRLVAEGELVAVVGAGLLPPVDVALALGLASRAEPKVSPPSGRIQVYAIDSTSLMGYTPESPAPLAKR
ncbi:hypothetical protein GXW82_32290 [Streptacidiphilus sp. 4-A2]|nr:hypothetical protein [Streptacidiphilus sp. 4-A2]